MLFVVTIAYPALNSILTVLALMILLEIKKERHHFVPWICELVAFLSVVVGDSWFAVVVLTAIVEQLWISALLLSAHYLLIAGGLVYYLRHHIEWHSKDLVYRIVSMMRNRASKKVLLYSFIMASLLIVVGMYSTNAFTATAMTSISSVKRHPAFKPPPHPHRHHLPHHLQTMVKEQRNLLLGPSSLILAHFPQ